MMLKKYTRMVVLMFALAIVLGLAACGGKVPDESQIGISENTNIQDQQPTIPENTIEEIDPEVLDTSPEDYMWIGLSGTDDRQYMFVLYTDYTAKLYAYDPEWTNTYYLEHPYECSWTPDGEVMTISAYEGDGKLVFSTDYVKNQSSFYVYHAGDRLVDVLAWASNNDGIKHSLTGKWYYVDHSETIMEFYDDGSFRTDQFSGSYHYTSKYDQTAVSVYNESTGKNSTYCYDFLENDLLLIYDDLDPSKVMMFYRSN